MKMHILTFFVFSLICSISYAQQPQRELKVMGDKYGFTDGSGTLVIKDRFEVTEDVKKNRSRYQFSEWRALVTLKGKYGFINPQGMVVISYKYDKADKFSNLRASFVDNGKCGYIDRLGKEIVPAKYEPTTEWGTANPFKAGFAAVTQGKDFALLDTSGKELTGFDYEEITIQDNGVIVAKAKKKYGLLDGKGKEISDFDYYQIGQFNQFGLSVVKEKKNYGIMKKDGSLLVEMEYDEIFPFDKYGVAKATKDGKTVFLDRNGKENQ